MSNISAQPCYYDSTADRPYLHIITQSVAIGATDGVVMFCLYISRGRSIATLIVNVDTRWRQVVNTSPWPLRPGKQTCGIQGGANLDISKQRSHPAGSPVILPTELSLLSFNKPSINQ